MDVPIFPRFWRVFSYVVAMMRSEEHMPGTHQRPEGSAQRPISLFLSLLDEKKLVNNCG